jgi:hypothetical protein
MTTPERMLVRPSPMKAHRQPTSGMFNSSPNANAPITMPNIPIALMVPIALPRWRGPKTSASMLNAAGYRHPNPRHAITRTARSCQ